jgi:purine catabolism regulator
VATAARKLHVHRHTLEYRLERITKLLGSDLKDPARRLLIELALSLYDE